LVQPFPAPGKLVALAYRELDRAAAGSPEQIRALGDARLLPRPWEPASCRTPQLREQLWLWLDAVVSWLISEYVWEAADTIPACWPQHPHLVHEIAVLADQRRRAGHAFTSDALEEWHRYSLPAFTERMKSRLRNHCEDGHQAWPAKGRHTRHAAETSRRTREEHYATDVGSLRPTDAEGRHRPGWGWSILTQARSTISRARRSRRPGETLNNSRSLTPAKADQRRSGRLGARQA
jgi:hypothetical protein